jgi:alpha-ketoglutaric semialdehyde dehydrogenase
MLTEGEYSDGCYFVPSLYELTKPEGALWDEELFGPVAAVIRANDPEEALLLANTTRYGLVASVFTQSLHWAHRFAQGLQTGIVQVNRATTGADVHVPFGGMKASGSGGREQGLAAREFYTRLKTVYLEWK